MKVFLVQDTESYEELVEYEIVLRKSFAEFDGGYGGLSADSTVEIVQPEVAIVIVNYEGELHSKVYQGDLA